LTILAQKILEDVSGCAISADQLYRETDLAIDFCEDVVALPSSSVDRIVALFEDAGATAKVSSIHVNGWFVVYDKLTMSKTCSANCLGINLDEAKDSFVFVGDAPNDAPMCDYVPHAVGVANVRDFEAQLTAAPAYITQHRGGSGFAEFVAALLDAKGAK